MKAKNRTATHRTVHASHTNGHSANNGHAKPRQADAHPVPRAKATKPTRSRARKSPTRRKPRPAPPRRTTIVERFMRMTGYLHGLRLLAENYVLDRAESVKRRSQEAVHTAVNRIVGGAVLLTVLVMIVVLTINGIAGAFAEVFGGRAWAGDLTTAAILLLGVGIGWATLKLFQQPTSHRRGRARSPRSPEPMVYSA
jgi:hypothetical protein